MAGVSIITPVETSDRSNSGMAVFVQDQTTEELDVPFLQERTTSAVAVETTIDDRVVSVDPGHGAIVGNILELASSTGEFMQSKILSISVNDLTIDQPVNHVYLVDDIAVISTDNMLVDGSSTPQVFSILPLSTQAGDMVRVIIDVRGTGAMDFSTFGSDPVLTNGCVLRIKREDGDFRNIFNWKNNGDFINRTLDHDFLVNNGNNQRAFVSRSTFGGQDKRGVVIRLDGSKGEELQVVIQDDLTGGLNTEFRMIAQGHELQGEN